MAFRKLNALKSLVVGSITSDTGSAYSFGYDERKGLEWLERTGIAYTPGDQEWREAERFIQSNLAFGRDVPSEAVPSASVEMGRPQAAPTRVTRHVQASGYGEMGQPDPADFHQPSFEDDGIQDDAIAQQAAAYLRELED